jgi:hypothetical protein
MVKKRLRVNTNIGRRTAGGFLYPSEPGYFAMMQATSKALVAELNSIIDQFEDVAPDIMLDALEPTMKLADYYCPKDTYATVNSRYLEVTSRKGSAPRVEAGYAKGGKPFYAALVHERTWVPHREPTRSKWLQAAMMEDLSNIFDRVAGSYSDFMGANG